MKIILGIDPGLSGAIAAVQGQKLVSVFDMPTVERKVGKSVKRFVAPHELHTELAAFLIDHECECFIEQVSAMPGQGVTSMFSMGQSLGVVLGVLTACEVPTTTIQPRTWQKALDVPQGKDGSRYRAAQLFPDEAGMFARVKDDGRSDAALIALYGAKQQ